MEQFKLQRGGGAFIRIDGMVSDVALGFVLPNMPTNQIDLTWRDVRELASALQGILTERDRLAAVPSTEETEHLAAEAEAGYPITQIVRKDIQ